MHFTPRRRKYRNLNMKKSQLLRIKFYTKRIQINQIQFLSSLSFLYGQIQTGIFMTLPSDIYQYLRLLIYIYKSIAILTVKQTFFHFVLKQNI